MAVGALSAGSHWGQQSTQWILLWLYRRAHSQSTKETTFPVLPPTFLRAEAAFEAALESMGPAVEEARDRPWEALDAAEEAASAPLEADSDEDEAYLAADLRDRSCDWRSTARDAVIGMMEGRRRRGGTAKVTGCTGRPIGEWTQGRRRLQNSVRICGWRSGSLGGHVTLWSQL